MKRVTADKNKNRLYLRFSKMTGAEMADEVIEVANAVKQLKPGFTCLTEISELTEPTEKEKRMARLVMEYLSMMGVSHVVRIGSEAAFEILNQTSREVASYSALRTDTMEEAEALLDQLVHKQQ
jgi:hypothetical protein